MTGIQVVGRDTERELIAHWLDGDRPASLLIDGEAGIGKSTLWSYAVEQATERGDLVLPWRASIAERSLAYAALSALFDRPPVAAVLAHLADPRRRALETALGRVAPAAAPPEPSLVGMAVADALGALVGSGPLAIAIDDVQWSDQPSEAALAFAARRMRAEPVGFVLARRTGGSAAGSSETATPVASGGGLAAAVDRCERLEIGPMSVGALGRLFRERLGVAYPRPLLVRLHDACAGNPFLGLEIGHSLLARGAEPTPGEPLPVPAEAGPLVRDHLASLSRDARRGLVIVAMSAEPTAGLIQRVLGDTGERAIDEAFEKGVLTVDGQRVRPAHPLFASTAYADSPPGERRALRKALAEIAEDPVERAIHLAAGVEGPDAVVATALAEAAGIATGRGAPGTAAELLERAAGIATSDELRGRYLIDGGVSALASGDAPRAAALLRIALDTVPMGRLRAEALLALGELVYLDTPTEGLALVGSALDHVEDDPILEVRVHLSYAAMSDPDLPAGRRSAERAVAILQQPGVQPSPGLLGAALLERSFHRLLLAQEVAVADIERGTALIDRAEDSSTMRRAQELAERCAFMLGRLDDAIALDEAERERLVDRGQSGLLPAVLQPLATIHLFAGHVEAAERYAQELLDLVEGGEDVWRDRAMMPRATILAQRGELAAARAIAAPALAREEADGDPWEAAIWSDVLGFVELSIPDPEAASRNYRRSLALTDGMGVQLPVAFGFLGDLVEAAVLDGELDLADWVLRERLEPPARRLGLPWDAAMAARGRGLLEAARGHLDEALRQLDLSIRVFDDRLAWPFERARTVLARGQLQRRTGRRRAARRDVTEALAVFERLGARIWAGRATQELGRIGGRAPAGLSLTASERTVAELAAAGRSNREIAAELVVSVRTVESQLSAAYRKLDIRARSHLREALAATSEPPST